MFDHVIFDLEFYGFYTRVVVMYIFDISPEKYIEITNAKTAIFMHVW